MILDNIDPHGLTATFVFPEELAGVHPNDVKKVRKDLRNVGKVIGFASDYGGTEYTIAKTLGIDKKEARKKLDNYWEGFKVQAEFNRSQVSFARRNGYVKSLFGHKRHVEGINSENWGIKGYAERTCANAPIQGTGADVVSLAQIAVSKDPVLKALNYRMSIQVYDEIEGICPTKYARIANERIKYHMNRVLEDWDGEVLVPLASDGDVGYTYAAAK